MNVPARYRTLAGPTEAQLREQASRFIAYAFPIDDEVVFKERYTQIAREHHAARHWCYAWVLGADGSVYRAHDAAEPSGTAGRPILQAIRDKGLTQVAVVVVRYFGGTLLGKAGLVRAYGGAARLALEHATIMEHVVMDRFRVTCGHALMEQVRNNVSKAGGELLDGQFDHACHLHVALPRDRAQEIITAWTIAGAQVTRDQRR
ncbi:MAG: YigZ family protein [Flavobacteriales bacterium]|nr:YigZ family protein [Flavobacteriales bacterium]